MKAWFCIATLAAAGWLIPTVALAHRFGGPNDPCERKIGSSFVHITLYQPQFDPDAEYCNEVPREGNTVLVVDVLGDDLRRVAMGVEIVATGGSPARTVLSLPPRIYRRGVADAQVMLSSDTSYVTRISLDAGAGIRPLVLAFPIRVAAWYRALIVPALIVLAVIALTAISVVRYHMSSRQDPALSELADNLPATGPRRRARGGLVQVRSPRVSKLTLLAFISLLLVSGSILLAACRRAPDVRNAALPNVEVIDDHGRPLSLASLRGKVVLLNFIHVGCPGVCSNLTNKFGQVADSLGPELGSKVILLSVTNDPEHDNPTELLKLARSSEADMSGWLFVTGKPDEVGRVIKAFGLNNQRLPDGSPNHITQVFLLGPDGHAEREYQGMVMDSQAVVTHIRNALKQGGAS